MSVCLRVFFLTVISIVVWIISVFCLSRFRAFISGYRELGLLAACGAVNYGRPYIFILSFVLLSIFFFFSSPNLSRRRLDVCHTSTHGVALVRI